MAAAFDGGGAPQCTQDGCWSETSPSRLASVEEGDARALHSEDGCTDVGMAR